MDFIIEAAKLAGTGVVITVGIAIRLYFLDRG
jgi:hypothetical protein